MRPFHKVAAALVVGVLALAGCGGDDPLATDNDDSSPAPKDKIVIGSANFPENVLLAEIYAGALTANDVEVSKKLNIGSRETYMPGLEDGSVDLIPEYTGVLLQYFDEGATATESEEVYAAIPDALPESLTVLDKSAAEDKDAVVVTQETAEKYDLTSISDLKAVEDEIVLGGPPEWKNRPTGLPGFKKLYDIEFKSFRALDVAGPLTIQALKNDQVQAGNLFTTQSAITENNFVVLEDPESLFAAQNVVPLINKEKATDTVKEALNAVSAKLDTETLAGLVKEVEVDKKNAADVAESWLSSNGLN